MTKPVPAPVNPGDRFGRLTILSMAPGRTPGGNLLVNVRCDCGSPPKTVILTEVRTGRRTSCGCAKGRFRHGYAAKDGAGRQHRLYAIWVGIWDRCTNPKAKRFARYGGRGIRVCERWEVFENFLADVGPRPSPKHSIDRIDNDKGYEPGNVRWATHDVQMMNTSRVVATPEVQARMAALFGAGKRNREIADEIGVKIGVVQRWGKRLRAA